MDEETAKRECRAWLDNLQQQIERFRQLIEHSDLLEPDVLRVSYEESMEMKRAVQAAISWFQILVQLRAGGMRCGDSDDLP